MFTIGCRSYREYEDRAVALAQNATRWEAVRRDLLEKVQTSPLFDMALYVRHLERAWHAMWELHAAGLPPQHIRLMPRSTVTLNTSKSTAVAGKDEL